MHRHQHWLYIVNYRPRDPRRYQHIYKPWHPGLNKDTDPALVEEWKKGKVHTTQMILSEADLHASEIYQRLLYDLDIEYSLGCSYSDENNSTILLGIMRGRKDQPFTQSDCDLLEQLVPPREARRNHSQTALPVGLRT